MSFEGTIVDGAVVFDEPLDLPNGTRVEILPKPAAPPASGIRRQAVSDLGAKLLRLAGQAVDLPDDAAAQHDHYLHGTPKR